MFVTDSVIRYAWNKKGGEEKKVAAIAVGESTKKSSAIGKRAPAAREFIRPLRMVGKFGLLWLISKWLHSH